MTKETDKGFDWVWNVLPPITLYHALIVLVAGYCGTIDGYSSVYPVFAQFKQPVRCPNELDQPRYVDLNLTFVEIVNLTSVPAKPYDECKFYNLDFDTCPIDDVDTFINCSRNLQKDSIGNCSSDTALFDTSQFVSTVPSEFKISCGSDLNALATSLSFIGLFIGSYLAGYSDKFGRKLTIIVSIGCSAVFVGLQGVVPSFPAFVVIRILVQAANQAAYITYNVYACEVVGPSGRAYTGMIPNFTFAAGYMLMSLLSFAFPSWRILTLVISGLSLPFVFTYWLWPESPRWLYSVGKYEEGEKVILKYVEKSNVNLDNIQLIGTSAGSHLSPERRFLDTLKQKCQLEDHKDVSHMDVDKKQVSMLSLFTSGKYLALTTVNVCLQFIVIVMAYYGLSFSAGDLPGDIYVNNVINGLVEIAAYVITFFVLNTFGRRALTAGPLLFAGVCMIFGMLLTQFVTDEEGVPLEWTKEVFRWLMFAGKLGVSGAFAVIWIYSAELFPTDVRGNALGLGSMVGRIGGVCAPFINNLWSVLPWLPPTIYGVFCVIGGIGLFFLPETSGRPMLNTIEEAEAYYGRRASRISTELQSVTESVKNLNSSTG